jgi:nicotinate (nicotinamide) nucleotide adenylyltransferase
MKFAYKAAGNPRSVAILAGAFNPPTTAHVALATTALDVVDEVVLAIPRSFPHKQFDGATLDQRIAMLQRIASAYPNLSAAVADGGLFVEIAREARGYYPGADIHLLCGRDAAERIITWDYGDAGFVERMLDEFRLLVAPRQGEYVPPEPLRHAVRTLATGNYDECSATRFRDAIKRGEDWRPLVPKDIADLVEEIYR